MISIVRNIEYKNAEISITYTSGPQQPPHHGQIHKDFDTTDKEKKPSFFFPPQMTIRFKGEEININTKFHVVRTYAGKYFTHYFPYRFFESPLNLSQEIVDSLIVKDQLIESKNKKQGE